MKKLIYILFAVIPYFGVAQPELTLEEAIVLALNNNYDIRLVAKDVAIAENNVHVGNAGMLPVVSGDVSSSASIQNTEQTLLSGETRSLRGAKNRSTAYGASLDWTIFDGLQMFTRYEQLKELKALGDANLKSAILTTVFDVMSAYFDLVQQQQLINATQTALELSAFRYQTAENRYQIGRASKLDVLAASVDMNTDTTNLLRQRDQYRSTQIRLNELLARDVNIDFGVTDTIIIAHDLNYETLARWAKQLNPTLQSAIVSHRISELELKRVKGERYPVVSVSSSYTRSQSRAALGFSTRSRNNGFNYGIAASMNIFNGFMQRRNEQNAEFSMEAAEIEVDRISKNIEAQLLAAYQTYLMNLELVRLEERNKLIAQENMDITLEKFKLGSIAPLEFREAQRNFVDASTRYSTAQFQAKLAEITLNQIAGTLKTE
ncbi:TolC family protein [Parapedobacter koreensis]|uniref:Outer membrane protein TolC n=1 Tax=Parapedobacter koreensis TaxID=332977 RepID=A0A1H7NW60_9SPHI|nr:TolC family protein [Parapedobacter koreensis]SEL27228.1 Outer membrane protein TolC [Parapedobacter koreensis]